MVSISVRPERYSHSIIEESGEFVINLVTEKLIRSCDWCGVKSGRDVDKFKFCHLTARPAEKLEDAPLIEESPVNIECRVTQKIPLGSHDMFLAEIVSVSADEKLIDDKGAIHLDRAGLIAYSHGHYFPLKKAEIGRFGYSVMKPKTRKRYEAQKRAEYRQAKRAAASRKGGRRK